MESKEISRKLKQILNSNLLEKGFVNLKGKTYVKIENDIMQIVTSFISGKRIYVNIAIQPMYVKSDLLILNLGDRIEKFGKYEAFPIINNKNDLESSISQIERILGERIFSWFDKYSSPKGLLSYIQTTTNIKNYKLIREFAFPYSLFISYSLLYLKRFKTAEAYLQLTLKQLYDSSTDFHLVLKNDITMMMDLIQSNPKVIQEKLQSNTMYTIKHLGIE